MSFSGTISGNTLAVALDLIGRARATGILEALDDRRTATLAIEAGGILLCRSNTAPRLGELFVAGGHFGPEQLESALWVQRHDGSMSSLGAVLLAVGLASPEAVRNRVEAQIAAVLADVLGWQRGRFRFTPQAHPLGRYGVADPQPIERHLLQVALAPRS